MKKLLLLAVLAGFTGFAMAQDLDEIRNMTYLNQTAKAKEAIDKFLASEKNAKKPEGWFWKAYITNQLSKDSTKSVDESSALKTEAFELFKKYRQMDPKATLLAEDNNSPFYDLYSGFGSDLAIKAYNAKNYNASFENFKKALEVQQFSVSNDLVYNTGYKFPALDTLFTQYAALTAIEAKRPDDAVPFHKKIVDAGLAGENFGDSYNFLADYYKGKKDKANFYDVIAKAKKNYPNNARYWTALEIELETDGVPKPEVFKKYEELVAANPTSYDVAYNYAAELFNFINSDASKNVNLAEYKSKLTQALTKVISIKSTFDANFLMTVSHYNNSFDLSDEAGKIKGVKPEDQKKKKALQADALKAINDAIPFGEAGIKGFSELATPTGTEKANYRKLLSMMKNMYEVKKDNVKMAEYDKMLKAAL